MKVSCPSCRATLNIDDKKVPATGARVKCPTCQHIFPVKPGGAVPLPGSTAATSTVPLPGARAGTGATAAVPLPGSADRSPTAWQDAETRAGVLPRASPKSPVPLPGATDPFGSDEPTRVEPAGRSAVPLPGAATVTSERIVVGPASAGVPLPGAAAPSPRPASERGRGVPLPGAAFAEEPDQTQAPRRSSPSGQRSVPLPGAAFAEEPDQTQAPRRSSPSGQRSVPLPGAAFAEEPEVAQPGQRGVPLPGGAQGAQEESLEFDLSSPSGSISLPPAPAFDFELPAPSEGAPQTSEPSGYDFEAPGAPAEAPARGAFDFSPEPASEVGGPSMGFGEVDIGAGDHEHDLEFDPTAAPRPAGDELEADLSAPIPPPRTPAGPVDGLEMLSFIDDTAREAGGRPAEPSGVGVRRFHVKRRSGKVFGPFDEAVIVKMLEDSQLLGNEEVSLDGQAWQPVGSEPAFQPVIARLMEGPSSASASAGATAPVSAPVEDKPRGPSMERLKQLYEGRMAAVAVVQSKEPVPLRKRIPLIAAGLGLGLILVAGVSLGLTTPYGYFGLKILFPAKVRNDTREAGYLDAARKGFFSDTWKGYTQARDSASQALAIKEFPEARAVWSQAVFYLKRKYGKATPEELARAAEELPHIKLLGEKHPEVLRTFASEALTRKAPDEALGFISDALARDAESADENAESNFLRAEAYLEKRQPAQAKGEYELILKKSPRSARALHALGLLHKSQNQLDEASARFKAALEADPAHLASAIELAEITIMARHDTATGTLLLDTVLGEKTRPTLSPGETGKALALQAETKVVTGKIEEAVPLFEAALKADANNSFTQARLGRVYLQLHELDKAAPLLQKAVTASPENLDDAESYLSVLIGLGRMDEARKVVDAATGRFPGNAMLAYLSGRVSDALDNPKEAEAAYRRAIAADPKAAEAYLFLARLYMRFRRFSEAKPELEAGLAQAPDDPSLRVGMGELAYHERDLDRAEKELSAAIQLDPALAEASLALSRVSQEQGKLELAAAQADRALELNPHLLGGKLQRGVVLWKLGHLDEAVQTLREAEKNEPRNLQVLVSLGAVELDRGDLKKARERLSAVLAIEPSHADGNFYLARVENAERHHSQAIDTMKRALDFNPKNPQYHYWMGRILNDARKGDDALAEWKRALELDETYADALEALGRTYFERNELKKAVKHFEKALSSDPGRVAVQVAIGDAQMKLDDWDGAIASYQKALSSDPSLTGIHYQLGQAWEEKHQVKKAIDSYLRATQSDPSAGEAWRQLGWLHKGQGKKRDAAAAFKKYLALRPEAEDKKQIEDELFFLNQ